MTLSAGAVEARVMRETTIRMGDIVWERWEQDWEDGVVVGVMRLCRQGGRGGGGGGEFVWTGKFGWWRD